ncbi:spermine synthase [Methylomonas sp. HYX-M1]|uniref:spermine/spermidine synthase domain-containing protein n=1 Tax=Methylomonas sp. HYX-M1 TaxID=3139307 RepID=UPI00345B7B45
MYKYDGLVVHQSFDEEGVIEVVEKSGERALHFGSSARQSSMLISAPDRLHSLYARAMMALLLFQEQPRDVLMIGLGGGTIAKFMLRQFADCRLFVVEFRSSVLKVARSHFGLPFDPRLKIKIGCGAQHVSQQSRSYDSLYDLVMIDAYDHDGMAPEVSSELFFDNCRTLLKSHGMLAINLWGTQQDLFKQVSWNLGRVFDWRQVFLPVRNRGNIIAFAFGRDFPKPTYKTLADRAMRLEQRYQLEFPAYLLDIKRNNPRSIGRIVNK